MGRASVCIRDAAQRGTEDGGLAWIEGPNGSSVLRVSIDATVCAGTVLVPMHWTDQFSSLADPFSGQPDLKGTRLQGSEIAESWRGLLLRRATGSPDLGETLHWSKAPIDAGYVFEMFGRARLAEPIDSEHALRSLLGVPDEAELISYSGPKRSEFHYAGLVESRLEACVFFAAPRATFPQAFQASQLLGQRLELRRRSSLLAGVKAGPPPTGKIICSCFSMGEAAICEVIRAEKLTTAAEIGAVLRAGTNCGTCIPELKKLLAPEGAELPAVV